MKSKLLCGAAALLPLAAWAQATPCETLRTEIEAKIRAGGVREPVVLVLDAGDAQRGRNVGTCERGSKRIVYLGGAAAGSTPAAARPKAEPILTECKDGTVSVGGSCGR